MWGEGSVPGRPQMSCPITHPRPAGSWHSPGAGRCSELASPPSPGSPPSQEAWAGRVSAPSSAQFTEDSGPRRPRGALTRSARHLGRACVHTRGECVCVSMCAYVTVRRPTPCWSSGAGGSAAWSARSPTQPSSPAGGTAPLRWIEETDPFWLRPSAEHPSAAGTARPALRLWAQGLGSQAQSPPPPLHRTCCASAPSCCSWGACSPSGLVSPAGIAPHGRNGTRPGTLLPPSPLVEAQEGPCSAALLHSPAHRGAHPPGGRFPWGPGLLPPSWSSPPPRSHPSPWRACCLCGGSASACHRLRPPACLLSPSPVPGVHQVQGQHLPGLRRVRAWLRLVPEAGKSLTERCPPPRGASRLACPPHFPPPGLDLLLCLWNCCLQECQHSAF